MPRTMMFCLALPALLAAQALRAHEPGTCSSLRDLMLDDATVVNDGP